MSNLPYTTGRPAGNLTPAQNRPSMQTNNDSINAILPIDHFGFNDNNGGYHQKVTFPDATSPVPTASGTLGVLYSILDSANASQLVFKNKNNTFQLTGITVTSSANPGTAGGTIYTINTGWGVTIYAGQTGVLSQNVTRTVTFPVAFTTIYTGVVSANVGSGQARAASAVTGTTALAIILTGANLEVNWFAIGKI